MEKLKTVKKRIQKTMIIRMKVMMNKVMIGIGITGMIGTRQKIKKMQLNLNRIQHQ